jgi:hypothetical protein
MRNRLILLTLLMTGCSHEPTTPSAVALPGNKEAVATAGEETRPSTGGAPGIDVKAGPITLQRVRVSVDGTPRFYAESDRTYVVQAGAAISLWIEWTGDTNLADPPRLVVQWGAEGADNIHCGPCLLTHKFKEGLHAITVRMDDRAGGVTMRTFFFDVRTLVKTVIQGELSTTDPYEFVSPQFAPFVLNFPGCPFGFVGDNYHYDTHVLKHPGGPLRLDIEGGTLPSPRLAVYSDTYDTDHVCNNVRASGWPTISAAAFPPGNYVIVVWSALGSTGLGTYTLTIQ